MKPCLFDYATKELSQDAFFCWLLSWSKEKYKENKLNKIANDIIYFIIGKRISILKIDICRQYKDIDFYIRLNENITILFEDKIKTIFHDNQLEKYKKIISRDFPNDALFLIYLKSDIILPKEKNTVENNGYKIIDIFNIIGLLSNNIDNDIFNDYKYHLKQKHDKYLNFEKIKYSKWTQEEWYGFFYKLIVRDSFNYVDYGLWQGRELYLILIWLEYFNDKNYHLSLELKHSLANNTGGLSILLHIENSKLNKAKIKQEIINNIYNSFKEENFKINNRTGKQTSVITFNDFPVINTKGYIDYLETKKYLSKIIRKIKKL